MFTERKTTPSLWTRLAMDEGEGRLAKLIRWAPPASLPSTIPRSKFDKLGRRFSNTEREILSCKHGHEGNNKTRAARAKNFPRPHPPARRPLFDLLPDVSIS